MSIYLSLNEELHNNLNEDAIFTPSDIWQSEDEDNKGEDRGVRARFIQRVLAKDFKSIDALKIMQEKHTINFRLHRAGFFPQFYLNFFNVVSKLGQLISRHSRPIFDNITMSFQQ
ncbi:hypothetical protein RB213_001404 [Colletotrichum asianum]